jgi:universal stress protein A
VEYKHILVATDVSASGYAVVARARQLQVALGAAITILNVVEYSFINLGGDLALPPQIDIESQLVENATKKLADLVAAEAFLRCQQIIKVGVPKTEILQLADELHVDLIMVGSHGRHGLARLLGSTANAVMHSAKCDVLAVRAPDT